MSGEAGLCAHTSSVFNFWEPLQLSRERIWIPNMGAISSVCYSKLGICAYAFASRKSSSASLGSRQGAQTYSHLWDVDVNSEISQSAHLSSPCASSSLIISSVCEAKLYRAVMEHVNYRVGRYPLLHPPLQRRNVEFGNRCGGSISPLRRLTDDVHAAFLPSTFAMFTTTLAFSNSLRPPSAPDWHRTMSATLLFATGAIVGWPFSPRPRDSVRP